MIVASLTVDSACAKTDSGVYTQERSGRCYESGKKFACLEGRQQRDLRPLALLEMTSGTLTVRLFPIN